MPHPPYSTALDDKRAMQERLRDIEESLEPVRTTQGSIFGGFGGAEGPEGPAGKDGVSAGLKYLYSTSTTTEPANKTFRLNNTTLASATALYLSETDKDESAPGPYLMTWDDSTSTVKGYVILRSIANKYKFAIYQITGAVVDEGTWERVNLTHVASGGGWVEGEEFTVEFFRTGDKGTEGKEGKEGAAGATGATGASSSIKWVTSTAIVAPPSAQQVRFNNLTIGAVSKIWLHKTSAEASNVSAYVNTWDDSTSTEKGIVIVRSIEKPSKIAIFKLGSLEAEAEYTTLNVSFLMSNEWSYKEGEQLAVEFMRTGDQGEKGKEGTAGSTGPAGVDTGVPFQYSNNTETTAPEKETFKFDSTTMASITTMRISETATAGEAGSAAAWIQSWDDSTAEVKGYLYFRLNGFSSVWAIFKVEGAVTDEGEWDKVSVKYVAGNATNPFASGTGWKITFIRTGDKGTSGTNGEPGGSKYTYSTNTEATAPGKKFLKFNNASPGAATKLYISRYNFYEIASKGWINSWDDSTSTVKGQIQIQKDGSGTVMGVWNITGPVVEKEAGEWFEVPIENIIYQGTLANNDNVFLTETRTGDKGEAGAGGGGASGMRYKFDSGTTEEDPGAGEFRLNNATVASATRIFISEKDLDANEVASWIATWDDSTNLEHRGIITIRKKGTPTTYAIFDVTGALTDKGEYDSLIVTHKNSAGTWTNGDEAYIEFTRSGDKGATGEKGSEVSAQFYRDIVHGWGTIPAATATGTYYLNPVGAITLVTANATVPLSIFGLNIEDYNLAGLKTAWFRARFSIVCNATAPGALVKFTPTVYKLKAAALGAAGGITRQLETKVLEAEGKTGLAAGSTTLWYTSAAKIEAGSGLYAFVLNIEGAATAASSFEVIEATLQVKTE